MQEVLEQQGEMLSPSPAPGEAQDAFCALPGEGEVPWLAELGWAVPAAWAVLLGARQRGCSPSGAAL